MKYQLSIIFLLLVASINAQSKTRGYFGIDNYTYSHRGRLTFNTTQLGIGAEFFNALSLKAIYGKNFSNGKSKGFTKVESITLDFIGVNSSFRIPHQNRKLSTAFGLTLSYSLTRFNSYRIVSENKLEPYTNENITAHLYMDDITFQTIVDFMLSYKLENWEFKGGVAFSFLWIDAHEEIGNSIIVDRNWPAGGNGIKIGVNYIL